MMLRKRRIAIVNCDGPDGNVYTRGKRKKLGIWQLSEDAIAKSNIRGRTNIVSKTYFPLVKEGDFPSLKECDGIIIPGSIYNTDVTSLNDVAWLKRLLDFIKSAHDAGKPMLGMCFGHQAIGAAFGLPSFRLTSGIEIGFHRIELTEEGRSDALFQGAGNHLMALFFHRFHLPALPEGSVHLARNENCLVQSFRIGKSTWGVQFHPDYDAGDVRILAALKRNQLLDEPSASKIDLDRDGSGNRKVLDNFLEIVQSR
jgi:GMP synthase (glutamine-hydrolysing)